MKASDILLTLTGKPLKVWAEEGNIMEMRPYRVCVKYAWSSVEGAERDVYGYGKDFEEACDIYLDMIRGRTLVFANGDDKDTKQEVVRVLG